MTPPRPRAKTGGGRKTRTGKASGHGVLICKISI
nr:MAG TPA: hypothetical protein [Caudoviricetes sp.]